MKGDNHEEDMMTAIPHMIVTGVSMSCSALILTALSFLQGYCADQPAQTAAVPEGSPAKVKAVIPVDQDFEAFSLDGYFSCEVPKAWQLERKADKERRGIFEIELTAPDAETVPVTIYVSYYAQTNMYFKDYRDYVDSNSTDEDGIASETDKYGPVKTSALGGRKAFEFERELKEYLHPESTSDESVMLQERFYVLPAKDGFFVLHFSAPKAVFSKHLPVFERVARTFKGLP